MKEEMLNRITELLGQIGRLEQELKGYINDEEASEPIKYNIDKRKWEIEELLIPVKEEMAKKEEEKNIEIEKITKEANDRIERLERELKGYIHDEEASEPIKYNIDKIRWELEEKVKNINEQYEIEKNSILNEIEKTGIDLEEYGLKEKEEIEENKEEQKDTEETEESTKDKKDSIGEETKQNEEDNKGKNSTEEIPKVSKTRIVNPILTGSNGTEIDKNKKDEELEYIDLDEVGRVSNESIRILYDAKTDKYMVRNLNIGKDTIVERKKIQKIDKSELAEKLGKEVEELNNIDTNILQLLQEYDEKYNTSKADEYINMMTEIGKSKKDRQQEMQEKEIDIEYNLNGLYNKYGDKFSKEEIEELLSIANNASKKGIAKVKKGFVTTLMELCGRIISFGSGKIKQLAENSKKIALPESKREKKARENRAKAREVRLQENDERDLLELEEIVSDVEESERVEQEIQNTKGQTYTEKLCNYGEKFRDTYKVSEDQEKNRRYFRESEKIREEIKQKDYDTPFEWNNGNYTKVKDEENSL